MSDFDWFAPHTPVPEPVAEEDPFNETLRIFGRTDDSARDPHL